GVICFGAREGKQQTFALLDEWAPGARTMARDEALAELAGRYFTSHGPAKLHDFVWWSGLPVSDARAAVEMAGPRIARETIGGQAYWLPSSTPPIKKAPLASYLLPPFDEYTVAYKDRSAVLDPVYTRQVNSGNGIFSPTIVIGGRVVGIWKRAITKGGVIIRPEPFSELSAAETRAFSAAAKRYAKFMGAPAVF
ncbi:MAG TPA: winged helix DNA-binding domain-containing protein, partial [Blastocatellia bacterium]|nr:winged helix DNA-binding domain-containing protein [Blastocatellia bacterium]